MSQKGLITFPIIVGLMIVLILGLGVFGFFNNKRSTARYEYTPAPTIDPTTKDSKGLIFHTFIRGSFPSLGQNSPPNIWNYFIVDPTTKQVSALSREHPYFQKYSESARNYQKYNSFKHEGQILNGPQDEVGTVRLGIKQGEDTQDVWQFRPENDSFSHLTTLDSGSCPGAVVNWNSQSHQFLIKAERDSLSDSSTSVTSRLCVYDYLEKKRLFKVSFPINRNREYSLHYASLMSNKAILTVTGPSTVVVDLKTGRQRELSNYVPAQSLNSSITGMIDHGILPLSLAKEAPEHFSLLIYNLMDGIESKPILFDKVVTDPSADNDSLEATYYDQDTNQLLVKYTQYTPYRSCWFLVQNFQHKEQLVCTEDFTSKINHPFTDTAVEFADWYD